MKILNSMMSSVRKMISQQYLPQEDIDRFLLVFGGHVFFQTLRAAVKFDLFTLLDNKRKMSFEEIRNELQIEEQPLHILLLGLTSIKLLTKKGDIYKNSRLAKHALSKNSDRNVLKYIDLQQEVYYRGMPYFYEALKTNKNVGLQAFPGDEDTIYERLHYEPEVKKIFQDAMHEISVQANEGLVESVDFSDTSSLVDVGGGDGTNIIAIAEKYSNIRAVVFDLPTIQEISEENMSKQGELSSRLSFHPGNCFQDPFPDSVDTILLCHFCTIWSKEKNIELFQKAYDALPTGGKLIIFNQMQDSDRTGPLVAAIGSPYFLTIATGQGMLYTWEEYTSWMQAAGFKDIQKHKLPIYHGAIVARKS